jgi:hypothetical protein
MNLFEQESFMAIPGPVLCDTERMTDHPDVSELIFYRSRVPTELRCLRRCFDYYRVERTSSRAGYSRLWTTTFHGSADYPTHEAVPTLIPWLLDAGIRFSLGAEDFVNLADQLTVVRTDSGGTLYELA